MSLRRGFWRLTLAAWSVGCALLIWWNASDPFHTVHPQDQAEPHRLVVEDNDAYDKWQGCEWMQRVWQDGQTCKERYCAEFPEACHDSADWKQWNREASLAWQTFAYWRESVVGLTTWSVVVWGAFYLVAWIAAGFNRRQPRGES